MSATERAPIACTLSPADLKPRLVQIRQLTRDHLRAHRLEGNSLRLTYEWAAATELERIVALERQCCAFLDFELSTRSGGVELVVVGPEQEDTDTRWLFSQFLPEAMTAGRTSGCACCAG